MPFIVLNVLTYTHTLNDGPYDLMTKARWMVVGRNKQLDEGTGRQIWKCLDPLNCGSFGCILKAWHQGSVPE